MCACMRENGREEGGRRGGGGEREAINITVILM